MAHALMDWETLEADQIDQIMKGETPRPPSSSESDGGNHQVVMEASSLIVRISSPIWILPQAILPELQRGEIA